MRGKSKKDISDDGMMFSKAKQLRGALSQSRDYVIEQITGAARLAKLKKIVKETKGITFGISKSDNHVSMKGWIEFPGHRHYMRSKWERNYARYLMWLQDNKQIKEWDYEPKRFMFNDIKRGSNSYLPDFRVVDNNDNTVWHEIKGQMEQKDRTKMKRFLKYYPEEKFVLIDSDQYKAIAKEVKRIINEWE